MVTSITVVPNPSSPGSVAMWEQVQERFPVFSSYGGSGPGSLGTEEEDCSGVADPDWDEFPNPTCLESTIIHDLDLVWRDSVTERL